MPGVMRFEAGCKIGSVTNIEVGMCGGIPQDVHVMEVRCWHGASIEYWACDYKNENAYQLI